MIEKGANINAVDVDKRTPLHLASKYNSSPEIVKIFILNGANINAFSNIKKTPLHMAV